VRKVEALHGCRLSLADSFAVPVDAVFWGDAAFRTAGGDVQFADEDGGEQELGDLASGAHGRGVPTAGDVGPGFDETAQRARGGQSDAERSGRHRVG
jgi:hypothetical protein